MLFRFRCSIIKTLKKDNIRDGVYRGGLAGWVHHKHFGRFLYVGIYCIINSFPFGIFVKK